MEDSMDAGNAKYFRTPMSIKELVLRVGQRKISEINIDGRSSVPKVTTAVCTFALFTGNGFKRNFGDASGQRTLWRVKLYPCTACWPIGIVKFTARTLKRMIFRVVRSTYIRVGARILGAFYSFFVCQKNPPRPGSAPATRGQPPPSLSPSFKAK
ncbi:hypothetical protein TNCV_4723691 [Trichonephila clavipes]|uniref:Uncharacterized protein n=1 Tax=Trichonephila clavipes TaxID=2585209 RepID=A0A8X6W7H2_TRICX|nr:hypothetical protein TNCV_4723691 [Trichonephila clavipes]